MKAGGPSSRLPSVADTIVRYDFEAMRTEVRIDFSPEVGTQRLLKQSEISARFRKRGQARACR
ncbi:MAG: hypothetical protein C0502_01595 [Opitutus sp.]|nr:hypothetical protein [Opitutus sp.]